MNDNRAKHLATISIAIAGAGALACLPFRHSPFGAAGFALFEAGLVGGFADWFAVTALFRHPMGQTWIPHTAIIPANRDRIIDNLVALVENRLLNRESLQARLARTPLAQTLLDALGSEQNFQMAAHWICRSAARQLRQTSPVFLEQKLQGVLQQELFQPEATQLWKKLRQNWLSDVRLDLWSAAAFKAFAKMPAGPTLSTTINSTVEHMVEGFLAGNPMIASMARGFLNIDKLSTLVIESLSSRLEKAASDPADPLRLALRQAGDAEQPHPALQTIINRLRQSMSEMDPNLAQRLAPMILAHAANWLESPEGMDRIEALLRRTLHSIEYNPENLGRLDVWLRSQMLELVQKHHTKIGDLVRENLQVLSARQFSDELEERVGHDLQWIRVNGAVVGALVGLVLHLLLKLL